MTFSAAGQGARVLLFVVFFLNVEDKPAFLFSHFPSEERAVCLSAERRRIQPLQLKWGGGGRVLRNRGGRLQLDKDPRSAP